MGIYDDLIPESEKKKKKVAETSYGIYSDLIPKKPSQVAAEEVKKKPGLFERIKTGVSNVVSSLSGKKKIEEQIKSQEPIRTPTSVEKISQEAKIVKPNIFDNQIEYIKTSSAAFTPEAKQKIKEMEDRSKSNVQKNWTDRVYEMATTGKDIPFIGDVVEIPETIELLKAAERLKNNKATQQDAILLNDWLQQQNRDSTFGYKVLDVVIGSAKMGAEIYVTAGIYTAGKEATKKGVKYLMSKAGKEAVEDLVKKKGVKAIATKVGYGLAGEAVRTTALAPLKLPQDVLERQLVSKMETISGITKEEEGIGKSITKGYLDLFTEYASERGGDALGMISKLDSPVKDKLMKTAIYQTLVKLNPGKESAITKILARAGYDGIVSEMLEERMGEVFRGMLFEVGLSDQEFKLPTMEQLAIEAVSFAIPGTISKTSDFVKTKLSDVTINTVQLTPDAAIETVQMSDLKDTDAGNTIIAAAYKAKEEGNMVLVDLDSKTGNVVLTPKQNQVGVSISEEKVSVEAEKEIPSGIKTSLEALEQTKKELIEKVSVGKEGETMVREKPIESTQLTDNEITELKEIARASTNAKFFSEKIGKEKVKALKASGESVIGFFNQANKESDTEFKIPTTKLSSLGFAEVELPVAKAVSTTIDEGSVSSGFHYSLNNKWTIVYKNPSKKLINAAKQAGLEVDIRKTTAGYDVVDVSLPGVKDKEVDKATKVFNNFSDIYSGAEVKKDKSVKITKPIQAGSYKRVEILDENGVSIGHISYEKENNVLKLDMIRIDDSNYRNKGFAARALEQVIKKTKTTKIDAMKSMTQQGRDFLKAFRPPSQTKPKTKQKVKLSTTEDISKYIDSKKTKFREKEDKTSPESQIILKGAEKRLTSKFFEYPDIKNKTEASWDYLNQTSNSGSLALKSNEKEIINRLLAKDFYEYKTSGKKINIKEFKDVAIDAMMALDVIRSDTYATYGADSINMSDADQKTYILNSPYEHDKTGHFGGDFESTINESELEIKEIPPQEGNPTAKYAVVRKGVELTEENIEANVFNLAISKEAVQKWIDSRVSGGGEGTRFIRIRKKGLFGHFRTFDTTEKDYYKPEGEQIKTSHIAELQSDVFQDGRLKYLGVTGKIREFESKVSNLNERIKNLEERNEDLEKTKKELTIDQMGRKPSIEDEIRRNNIDIDLLKQDLINTEKERPELQEPSANEKLFLGYKNTWFERIVREAINIKALEGIKKLRLATPRTVAFVEMYTNDNEDGDYVPYEQVDGTSFDPSSDDLEFGDEINYGGEDMTIVNVDGYNISAAPSSAVRHFDADDAMREDLDNRWGEAKYEFEQLEEDWGKIDTTDKAQQIIDNVEVVDRLAKFNGKQKDIKQSKESAKEELDKYELQLKKLNENLKEYDKFIKLLKDGIIEKENLTRENFDLDSDLLKNRLSYKYGIDRRYWNILERTYHFTAVGFDGHTATSKQRIEQIEKDNIDNSKDEVEKIKEVIAAKKIFWSDNIKDIESRTKPTTKELKNIPKKVIENSKDNRWGYSLDSGVEDILERMAGQQDITENLNIDDFEQDWIEKESENYDPDFEGIYGQNNVFFQDKGYNNQEVWVVDEGVVVEEFYQPSEYNERKPSGIEDFDIEEFDGEQKTVLNFYDQQVIPYFKKLRKDAKLVEDDRGFQWWETELTEADANPPMAYRIKDDFAKAGITITDKQEKDIIKLNQKFFGDSNIKVVEQIITNSKALGAYHQQMIQILAGQANAKDTFYHEVVHKYLDVFLSRDEHIALLQQAQEIYQIDDLSQVEERLAEDFIKYAKAREGVKGQIRRFFDVISKRIRQYLKNYSKIDKLYDDIISGKAAKPIKSTKEKVTTAKNVTQVKSALKSVKKRISDLMDEVNAKIEMAKEMRYGLNTKNIAKLKVIYNNTRRFQEGDIETIRDSKYQELVDSVIEDVQIARPDFSEEEAFDYAMNLPTKADESFTSPELKDLQKRKKILDGYLVKLEDKALELANKEKIESSDAVYKEWKNALDAQEQLNKRITVAERIAGVQKPIEETETEPKLSKVAQRVYDKLLDVQQSDISYQPMSIVQDAAKASEFVEQEPDVALKIAKGLELPPPDITETAISIAMAEKARQDGNYLLYTRLILSRSMRQTRRGQEIVAEKARQDENSSEFFIKKLLDERAKIVASGKKWLFEKEVTIQKVVAREVKKVKNTIDSAVLKKLESAQKLIDSLTCK